MTATTEEKEVSTGTIQLKVSADLHAEIKAAAGNEGESVTVFCLNAIKERLNPTAAKSVAKAIKAADDDESPKTFESFYEWCQNNKQSDFVSEDLYPVIKAFMAGVNLKVGK